MNDQLLNPPTILASTLVELLQWRALHQSEEVASTFLHQGEEPKDVFTYRQLARKAQVIGAYLQSQGAVNQPVLLLIRPGLDYVASFFGAMSAGAIAVPAYPPTSSRTLPRLLAILADCQARCILTTTEILSLLKQYAEQVPEFKGKIFVTVDDLPDQLADTWSEPDIDGQSLAFLQYTSGSTGEPKGVMVSHSNLLHNIGLIQQEMIAAGRECRVVCWLPPYHDMGLIGGILYPFVSGGQSILMAPESFIQRPIRWLQAITRYKATVGLAPNFAFELCCRKVRPDQMSSLDLSSCNSGGIVSGAEPVQIETIRAFEKKFAACGYKADTILPGYGLAEGTLIVAGPDRTQPTRTLIVSKEALKQGKIQDAVDEEDASELVGYNNLLEHQRFVIAHPETRQRCASNEVGEIWMAGPSVAHGYWRKPQETEQTFHAYLADENEGPFLRTGDLGFFHDGVLYITGRLKDLIIIRGNNYYPQDIELTVTRSDPAIRAGRSVVFSIEEDHQEQLVVLAEIDPRYVPSIDHESAEQSNRKALDGEALVRTIQQAISEQHGLRPQKVALLKAGSILVTSSGKLRRRASRSAFLAGNLETWGK